MESFLKGRLSHYEYQCLVDQAPVMIWRSGRDGLHDYFNERWLSFRRRSMEQEAGDGWREGVYPEDRSRCQAGYREAFERREAFEMRYRLLRGDGEFRWVRDHGAPYFSASGEFQGYIGSCTEIAVEASAAPGAALATDLDGIYGVLPICCVCKKIRDEQGEWEKLETYISRHSKADFSHGLCPDCLKVAYRREETENGIRMLPGKPAK
jgi:PAS domain S-box-containing protein